MKRIYLSGPMTGLPDFNYPAFHAEAARLRALGYHVENPAENPEQSCWEDCMKVAIRQMLTCDVVVMLPGWGSSRGAATERELAIDLGLTVVYQSSAVNVALIETDCGMVIGARQNAAVFP